MKIFPTCIVIEGVAGTGKTGVAVGLAEKLGLDYTPMKAPLCTAIPDPAYRQECFYQEFRKRFTPIPGRIHDNGFGTVYGYSAALLGKKHQVTNNALKAFTLENIVCTTVLLIIDEDYIRASHEGEEAMPSPRHHIRAQWYMEELGHDIFYDVTGEDIEDIVEDLGLEILELIEGGDEEEEED